MTTLTSSEREHLTEMLKERKPVLREEIRSGLLRMRMKGYEELLSGTSDAGDESIAALLTDIANADVARDAVELQDIFAAESRLAAGTFLRFASIVQSQFLTRVPARTRPRNAVLGVSRFTKRIACLPDNPDRVIGLQGG